MFGAIFEFYLFALGRNKLKFALYVMTIFTAAFCELMSVAAIIPLSASLLLGNADLGKQNDFFTQILSENLGIGGTTNFGILFIIFILASGILRTTLVFVQAQIGKEVGVFVGSKLFQKVIINSDQYNKNFHTGDVIAIVSTKLNDLVNMVITPTLVFISSSFIIMIIVIFLLSTAPVLSIASIVFFLFCYILAAYTINPKIKKWATEFSLNQNKLIRICQESLDGFADLKIYQLSNKYQYSFNAILTKLRKIIRNITVLSSLPKNIIETTILSLFMVYIIVMINLGLDVIEILPLLGGYALAAQRVLPLMQQCYASWTSINGASQIIKDISVELNKKQVHWTATDLSNQDTFSGAFKHIEMKNLSFGYRKQNDVLKALNLKIYAGEKIGIMGASGSGKSTLGAILLGLKRPTSGDVFINGRKLKPELINGWLKNVAYVSQNVFIADLSIAENVAFGINPKNICKDKLDYCLKITQLSNFLEEREEKSYSTVGERGNSLSSGQKQRIAIARALYKEAKFIVFDEPTSALDKNTERDFIYYLNSLPSDITLFIISHREEIFSVCDRVFNLNNQKLHSITFK